MIMWKQGSVSDELFNSMALAHDEIVKKEEEVFKPAGLKAMEDLSAAAEIFEKSGHIKKAKKIASLMNHLYKKLAQDTLYSPQETIPLSQNYEEEFPDFYQDVGTSPTIPASSVGNVDLPRDIPVPVIDENPPEWVVKEKYVFNEGEKDTVAPVKLSPRRRAYDTFEKVKNYMAREFDEFDESSALVQMMKEKLDGINPLDDDAEEKYKDFIDFADAFVRGNDSNDVKGKKRNKKQELNKLLKMMRMYGFLSKKDLRLGDKNDVFADRRGRLRAHGK